MFTIKNDLMLKNIKNKFNKEIIEALKNTNREIFIPSSMKHMAYDLESIPIGGEQFISSPLTVAKMTSYLMAYDLKNPKIIKIPDSVLEIGLGSGYQAVVLSSLIRRVFSIERIESLWQESRIRIAKLNIKNINIRLDDGINGWSEFATYDRILFSACTNKISQNLIDQLSEGGVIVAPMYNGKIQEIVRFIKLNGVLSNKEVLEKCEFVPIKDGVNKIRRT